MSNFSCSCLYFILHFAGSGSVRVTHTIRVTIALQESKMDLSVHASLCAINVSHVSRYTYSIVQIHLYKIVEDLKLDATFT